jgi:hypothetical protein
VKALLMGGQACILYGGAEFSRDVDFAVAVDARNLDRLRAALRDLEAEPVFFPPLSTEALQRGHACHFRCRALDNLRIDVMSVMRNADPFEVLWKRRTRLRMPRHGVVPAVSLPDLVRIKKTQRDKDWLMVRRLVEADVARAASPRIDFWLRECRTPAQLRELVRRHPRPAGRAAKLRPAVAAARRGDARALERELRREERRERAADRRYWAPLRAELERWCLTRSSAGLE